MRRVLFLVISGLVVFSSGCGTVQQRELEMKVQQQKGTIRAQAERIVILQDERNALRDRNAELAAANRALSLQLASEREIGETLQQKYIDALRRAGGSDASVRVTGNGDVELIMSDAVLFNSGSASLTKTGKQVLGRLVTELKKHGGQIRVDGHTDDQPIVMTKKMWPKGNWQLSAARALEVLLYLEGNGISSERMYLAAFGEQRPEVPNKAGHKGNPKNRRVVIRLMHGGPMMAPAPVPAEEPLPAEGPEPAPAPPSVEEEPPTK